MWSSCSCTSTLFAKFILGDCHFLNDQFPWCFADGLIGIWRSICWVETMWLLQLLVDGFQHEQPDYWLNFGNPWEIERLNVGYPIKFYGHVSVSEDAGRQVFKWIPGESVSPSSFKSSAWQDDFHKLKIFAICLALLTRRFLVKAVTIWWWCVCSWSRYDMEIIFNNKLKQSNHTDVFTLYGVGFQKRTLKK